MGRKRPHPSSAEADATFPATGKVKEPMTEAERAYLHAVEVCDRIVRELDEKLNGWTPNHTKEDDHGTK